MQRWNEPQLKRSQSHVPVLPPIGNHGNNHYKTITSDEAILRQSDRTNRVEQRMSSLELANKALLEEMMQIHTAIRSTRCKCECRSRSGSLWDITNELSQRVAHNESVMDGQQGSVRDLASMCRERGREREASLTTDIASLKRLIGQMEVEKKSQEVWLKESFSNLYEHVSWVSNQTETAVLDLSDTLDKLEDSTSFEHAQLAVMVTKTIDNKMKSSLEAYTKNGELLDERVSLLEKFSSEQENQRNEMANNLSTFSQRLDSRDEEHKAQFSTLTNSLSTLARDCFAERENLSTVMHAEIKTRQMEYNEVKGQCLRVQELCRGSVNALRECVISLEERLADSRREVRTLYSQLLSHCQDTCWRLRADLDCRLTSLHTQLVTLTERVPLPPDPSPLGADPPLTNNNKTVLELDSETVLLKEEGGVEIDSEEEEDGLQFDESQSFVPLAQCSNGDQTSLHPSSNDQTSLHSSSNDQTSLHPSSNDQTSLHPSSNDQTSLRPSSNDQTSLQSSSNDQTSLHPSSNDQTSLRPSSNDQTSLHPSSNDQTSLHPSSNDQTSLRPSSNELPHPSSISDDHQRDDNFSRTHSPSQHSETGSQVDLTSPSLTSQPLSVDALRCDLETIPTDNRIITPVSTDGPNTNTSASGDVQCEIDNTTRTNSVSHLAMSNVSGESGEHLTDEKTIYSTETHCSTESAESAGFSDGGRTC